jgi:hypothetical protein
MISSPGLKGRFSGPPAARRMGRELFEVSRDGTKLPEMFIINAKDSIVATIEKVLTRHFRGGA